MRSYLFLVLFLFSCRENQKAKKLPPGKQTIAEEIDIHDCTTAKDTVFANGDWVKYVFIAKDAYAVVIKMNNTIDTLAYRFNCNTNNGLIPKILSKGSNSILSQGCGFTYRNILVCSSGSKGIQVNEYETTIGQDGKDVVVFQENGQLFIWDRTSGVKEKRNLPKAFDTFKLISSEVFKEKIVLHFDNEKTLEIKI